MLVVICGILVEEAALTFYDRHFISVPNSRHADASYSLYDQDGGTFYLDQPNNLSSMGFRTMRAEPKVAVGRRILLLGDSFVVGTGGSTDTNYAQVLESDLQQRFPAEHITVFAAGVNGAGIEEQRHLFDYLIEQGYRFDAVVMHFYLGGDQINNPRGTTRVAIDGRAARIHTNPLLRYFYPLNFTSFRFFVKQNAVAHSSEWFAGSDAAHGTADCPISPTFKGYAMESARYSYGDGAQKRVDMPHVAELLEALHDDIQSKKLPSVLVMLPDYNIDLKTERSLFTGQAMNYDWLRKGLKSAVGGRYPVLDLTDEFMNRADMFQCNGIHWNDAGNAYGGHAVAPFVAQHLLPAQAVKDPDKPATANGSATVHGGA